MYLTSSPCIFLWLVFTVYLYYDGAFEKDFMFNPLKCLFGSEAM